MKKLAFITDIHLNEDLPVPVNAQAQWQRILADVTERGIKHLVFGGDIGDSSAYAWFFDTLKNFPEYTLLVGNHDTPAEAIPRYPHHHVNRQRELYYKFSNETFKYIVLDSSKNSVSTEQLDWLAGQMPASKPIILFIHHPVFGVNTPVDQQFPLHGRQAIQEILQQAMQEVYIFSGHYHLPDEQVHGHIRQYITPAASYQIKKEAQDIEPYADYFAYRIIMLDGVTVSSEVVYLNT
jgi:3',5'-cyclic-AMP phosphodiesterase